ncbi:MAG: hypothetical protein LBV17_09155 [Treponema sp.]|jgi:hypothetical protein|nr:hypothetical protein [Treponema sp.]
MQRIHISNVNEKPAVCFDTGLDPRSFARTKMSQCLIEPGYIVHPDGSNTVWKASGVNELDGYMRVWGTPFFGERLDLLLNAVNAPKQTEQQTAAKQAKALQAVVYWIKAKLLMGETHSALNPGAAFVSCSDGGEYQKGSVFFAPESLSQRCLLVEGASHTAVTHSGRSEIRNDAPLVSDRYNCPDLKDTDAAAFCAGTMLYTVLAKAHPYPDMENIYQDMREGIFVPPRLAIPGLNKQLCGLIYSALVLPVEKKRTTMNGAVILGNLLKILMNKEEGITEVFSICNALPKEEETKILKEKNYFIKKQNFIVRSKRFCIRNKIAIMGVSIAFLFVMFVIVSTAKVSRGRLTTEGMAPDTVINEYYEAFSNLNHQFMEACISGAKRDDIDAATNLFVLTRVRQTYEANGQPSVISAKVWKQTGGALPAPDVFGVTDLTITPRGGSEADGLVVFLADYLLWLPNEKAASSRSDELTLKRIRGNWRITEINRTLNSGF